MPITFDEVSKIISIIDNSTCEDLVVEADDLRLVVRRGGAASLASPAPAPMRVAPEVAMKQPAVAEGVGAVDPAPAAAGHLTVTAPMVGTFYSAPAPDKPAFVTEGSIVAKGDPLCLIEVMKLFTTVHASSAGRVEWVFPQDGALVEFGQTLFVIAPA